MFPPKALLDTFSTHAARLLNADSPLARSEIEAQLKILLQSLIGKLDLVSRDEFDSQMAVLARTRSRLEALEAKLAALETPSSTPTAPD
jgi:BMFP domain-containing protein YqiC